MTFLLIFVLGLVLWAEFVNGWTDAPNSIATIVSTRVVSPRRAVILATILNTVGAFSGIAVASTIGKGIVNPDVISLETVAAAMVAIIIWSTFAWKLGLPTSESHSLVAGLTGAAIATSGFDAIIMDGWIKVGIGLLFSTFLGFGGAYLLFNALALVFQNVPLGKVRNIFGKLQLLSAGFMAYSHGSNDGQKFIGTFSLALLLAGVTTEFVVPVWVILLCALTMGIGTSVGGWRIIKTMGMNLAKIEPQHGFAAETTAAIAIEFASKLGIPLSTTHTITTAIMGVGAAESMSKVRWSVVRSIVTAWVVTFPICGLIAFVATKFFLVIF